jgi:hypothetical protein
MKIEPVRMRSNVLFPAPFAPTKITLLFGGTTQSSPVIFGFPSSYEKVRFLILTTGFAA